MIKVKYSQLIVKKEIIKSNVKIPNSDIISDIILSRLITSLKIIESHCNF